MSNLDKVFERNSIPELLDAAIDAAMKEGGK